MFAECTGPNERKVYLAPAHVTGVTNAEKGSVATTVGGDTYVLKETAERVIKKLQAARGK